MFRHVPTFQSCWSSISEDPQRQDNCSDSCTRLVNPILVPAVATDDQPGPVVFSAVTKKFDIATQTLREPPAIRLFTYCKYIYIKQWTSFSKNIGHIEVSHALDFLSRMFDKDHAYSTINSAKSAIATIVQIPSYNSLNKHPLINKYMTGVFNLTPPKPKLFFVWDVDILFRYFEQQGDNNSLSDKLLTQKLITQYYLFIAFAFIFILKHVFYLPKNYFFRRLA